MATPIEDDFGNRMAADVELYFQITNLNARDRAASYHLAHDAAVPGFDSRQTLCERLSLGPRS